jgi:ketosteroid isomerase-like protein
MGAGDLAALFSMISEDAVFLAAERAPLRGRAAFAKDLMAIAEANTIQSSAEIEEVLVSDDLACCWATQTVTTAPLDGGTPTVRRGPVLSIFRKDVGGLWVLVRDANMLASEAAELALKVDNLERELMADGPGG